MTMYKLTITSKDREVMLRLHKEISKDKDFNKLHLVKLEA